MPFEYLEDVATADIAFEAWAGTLEETFISAAEATMNVMVESLDSIGPAQTREITVADPALDMLLFNFLQEIIFFKDAEGELFRVRNLKIREKENQYFLTATLGGERLDPKRHEQRVDVKAVTLHQFSLEQTEAGWRAHVILDI